MTIKIMLRLNALAMAIALFSHPNQGFADPSKGSSKLKTPSNCIEVEFQNAAEFSNLIAVLSAGKERKSILKAVVKVFEGQKEIDAQLCAINKGSKITSFTTNLLHPKTGEIVNSAIFEVSADRPDFFFNYELKRPRFQTQVTVAKPVASKVNSDDDDEDDRPMVAQEKMEMKLKSSLNRTAYNYTLTQTRPKMTLVFSIVKKQSETAFHFEGENGHHIQKITFNTFMFRNGIPEFGQYRIEYDR